MINKLEYKVVFGEMPKEVENNNITFICSYLTSGKTTISKGYRESLIKGGHFKQDEIVVVEVSDLVKKIVKSNDRSDLQGRPDLDAVIVREIQFASQQFKHVIVSGARQVSILRAFPKASTIWMEVPSSVRFRRFQASIKDIDKSKEGFRSANLKDIELGIQKVKEYIFKKMN